jgi:hypothetical protein
MDCAAEKPGKLIRGTFRDSQDAYLFDRVQAGELIQDGLYIPGFRLVADPVQWQGGEGVQLLQELTVAGGQPLPHSGCPAWTQSKRGGVVQHMQADEQFVCGPLGPGDRWHRMIH